MISRVSVEWSSESSPVGGHYILHMICTYYWNICPFSIPLIRKRKWEAGGSRNKRERRGISDIGYGATGYLWRTPKSMERYQRLQAYGPTALPRLPGSMLSVIEGGGGYQSTGLWEPILPYLGTDHFPDVCQADWLTVASTIN